MSEIDTESLRLDLEEYYGGSRDPYRKRAADKPWSLIPFVLSLLVIWLTVLSIALVAETAALRSKLISQDMLLRHLMIKDVERTLYPDKAGIE